MTSETVHAMTNVSIKHLLYFYEKLIISHNWPFSLPYKVCHWTTFGLIYIYFIGQQGKPYIKAFDLRLEAVQHNL